MPLNYTSTLIAETVHNTSADSVYNRTNFPTSFTGITTVDLIGTTALIDPTKVDDSENPITPAHVSPASVKDLVPNFTGKWYAHIVPWFRLGGGGGHIDVGLNNDSVAWVTSALTDMAARGFDGVIIDWKYGKYQDLVSLLIKTYLATNQPGFTYVIMVDNGSYTSTADLTTQLTYVQTTYTGSTGYLHQSGNPVVMFFGIVAGVNYATIRAAFPGLHLIFQGAPQLANAYADGAFDWVTPYTTGVSGTDPYNLTHVNGFLSTVHASAKTTMLCLYPKFNGTLTGTTTWSKGKYLPGNNGTCWTTIAAALNANVPTNCIGIQVATWNDYEEGTEIETSIQNSFIVTPTVTGNTLNWTVSGDESTVSAYRVLAMNDGVLTAELATLASGTRTLDLTAITGWDGLAYTLYVVSVGVGSVRDQLSAGVAYQSPLGSSGTESDPPGITENFNYVKSFALTGGGQYTLALDNAGTLWVENVLVAPGIMTPLTDAITPGSYMLSVTQSDVEYMCFSNLAYGTDVPRQYNPQPATGGYTLDRISQVGPGAPPTFQPISPGSSSSQVAITSWAGVGSIVTFQAVNSFTAGEIVKLSGFTTSTFFNNLAFAVLGTGLTGAQFQIAYSGYSGATNTGVATPQFGYVIQGITQAAAQSDAVSPGHFQALLWSDGVGSRNAGNVITVYYTQTNHPQDQNLVNQFNSGLACYVYVSGAPFGNGTFLITSIGSATPPGGSATRWYFTYETTSSNYQFFGGPDDATGTYQLSLATVTTQTPIPGLSVGDQITITGASPGGWNSNWGVVAALNSGVYSITQTSMSGSTATYTWSWAGTGTAIAPQAGQLVTVVQTLNGNGVFNVADALIATVVGGPSSGTFTITNFPPQTLPAVTEAGQAQTSGTKFQFDPGQVELGSTTSPIFGNAAANTGLVTIVSASTAVGAGTRQAVAFFETRNGLKTQCSVPITFTSDINATYILANNVPIGPPDVIRRWIAFTSAGPNGIAGPNFYTIDTTVTYTINNQTYTYTPTLIDDNVTTSAKFVFTDAVLLAGEEIDVQGNSLFNQIELGSSAWCVAYAGRMFYGLEQNKVQNFVNMSFDGGYLPNSGGFLTPLGWAVDPTSNSIASVPATITAFQIIRPNLLAPGVVRFTAANSFTVGTVVVITGLSTGTYLNGAILTVIAATATTFDVNFNHTAFPLTADSGTATPVSNNGTLVVSPVFGNAYYMNNQTGVTQSQFALLFQNAYQDAYHVPIILPNTLYSVRVTARIPSGKTVGNLVVDLSEFDTGLISGTGTVSGFGNVYGAFTLPFASMTTEDLIYSGTLLTTPFTTGVPTGLILRIWAQNIGNGNDLEWDRVEVFPTAQPTLTTNVRVSYVDNFEAFDGVTGNIGLAGHTTQPAYGAFELHDQLYFLQSGSMQSTQDIAGVEPSGPGGGWAVHEVSNRVGTCGIHAFDYGEEWVVTACRNGLYGFNGGQPIRIDFQQKDIWEVINWAYGNTIVVRNDLTNRRILAAVPLPTPNQWLPLAPTDTNPTSPNVVLMWNYEGLDTFDELVSGRAMHTTMFGTLASVDMRVKMTIWQITTPYMGFVTQPDLTTQELMICNGVGNGKIYSLSESQLSDDGQPINGQYFTWGFVDAQKATQNPLLGFHRKRFQMAQQLISGSGTATVSVYPNYILTKSTLAFNPSVYNVPGGIVLQENPPDDIIRPLNSAGNRVFVSYGTNAVGAAFNLSKMIMVGTIDFGASVNPNSG